MAQERCLGKAAGNLIDEPDYEWFMIDASPVKVHPHAAGARGDNQYNKVSKNGVLNNIPYHFIAMERNSTRNSARIICFPS